MTDAVFVLRRRTPTDEFFLLDQPKHGGLSYGMLRLTFRYAKDGVRLVTFTSLQEVDQFIKDHPHLYTSNVKLCGMNFLVGSISFYEVAQQPKEITRASHVIHDTSPHN